MSETKTNGIQCHHLLTLLLTKDTKLERDVSKKGCGLEDKWFIQSALKFSAAHLLLFVLKKWSLTS